MGGVLGRGWRTFGELGIAMSIPALDRRYDKKNIHGQACA